MLGPQIVQHKQQWSTAFEHFCNQLRQVQAAGVRELSSRTESEFLRELRNELTLPAKHEAVLPNVRLLKSS